MTKPQVDRDSRYLVQQRRAREEFIFIQVLHAAFLAINWNSISPLILGISGVVCTIVYGRLLLAEYRFARVQLHPMWFFVLSGLIRRGPATCWAAAALASGHSMRLGPVVVNEHVINGQLMLILGDLLFVWGFTAAERVMQRRNIRTLPVSPARLEFAAWCMLGTGWLLKALLAAGVPLDSVGDAVSIVANYASPAAAYLLYVYASTGRGRFASHYYAIFAVIIAVELLFSLSSYMKSATLILLMSIFLCAAFTEFRHRASGRSLVGKKAYLVGAVLFIGVVFVLFPYSSIRRSQYWVGSTRLDHVSVWPAMKKALAAALPGSDEFAAMHRFPDEGAWSFFARHGDVKEAAWIQQYVGELGNAEGMFFKDAVINLYPRVLWPEKPFYWPGRKIAVMLGQATTAEKATTSTAAGGIPSSGYLNFGWGGLIICSFLSGAAFSVVTAIVQRNLHTSPIAALIFVAIVVDAAKHFEGVTDGGLTTFVYYVVVFLPAMYLSRRLLASAKSDRVASSPAAAIIPHVSRGY